MHSKFQSQKLVEILSLIIFGLIKGCSDYDYFVVKSFIYCKWQINCDAKIKNHVALPTVDDPDYNPKEAKKLEKQMEKQDEQKKTFRGAAKAVSLASKLSPKAQQKKSNAPTTAQLKVNQC